MDLGRPRGPGAVTVQSSKYQGSQGVLWEPRGSSNSIFRCGKGFAEQMARTHPLRDGWEVPACEPGGGERPRGLGNMDLQDWHEGKGIAGHRAGQVGWGQSQKVCALS